MKKSFIFIIVILTGLIFSFTMHDFHTSTTKVEYNTGSSALSFTSKFVTEDLEKAVAISADSQNEFNAALEKYLNQNFTVKVNGSSIKYNYANAQTTPKATRIYFEVPNVSGIKTIEVKNSMLIGEFPEQQNFITFNIDGKRDSFVTKKGAESGKVSFE